MTKSKKQQILLVDSDQDFTQWAAEHLKNKQLEILRCDDAQKALKVIENVDVDLLIAGFNLQPFDGFELLKRVKMVRPKSMIVLMTSLPTTGQVIEATQRGAYDVLKKESAVFELKGVVESCLQIVDNWGTEGATKREENLTLTHLPLVGYSREFQEVLKLVGKVARSEVSVLIYGESGTGKELIAKAIHEYSPRCKEELVAINCGSIPANLLESELFGHEKGSFTGAMNMRKGRFEQADGGILFLDEIGDMPLDVQVKLLRVLQDGTFFRVGGNELLTSDVRIVAATNKDLLQEVSTGRFRQDLFYRLNVINLKLPPLRERGEDIALLAQFFLDDWSRKNCGQRKYFSEEAMNGIKSYHWPGNIRELQNVVMRGCLLSASEMILAEELLMDISPSYLQSVTDLTEYWVSFFSQKGIGEKDQSLWSLWCQALTRAMDKRFENEQEIISFLGISKQEWEKIKAS